MPRLREAYILSRMRSAVISRSNCAKDMRMLSIMRPAAFDVSICWVTETNDTSCCSKSFERSVKSQRERERRSILYTTTTLICPTSMSLRSSVSAGRFIVPPE